MSDQIPPSLDQWPRDRQRDRLAAQLDGGAELRRLLAESKRRSQEVDDLIRDTNNAIEDRIAKLEAEVDGLTAQNERYNIRAGEDATELARLRGENERLLGILQFSRWTHDTHRPSYALNCLYEGEITIAKFCEWMKAFVAGADEPLPDVKYRSCGSEFTPKELEAENSRLRAALERNIQGYRNIIEMRQMTNGRFGDLTREELEQSICEDQAALAGKEQE